MNHTIPQKTKLKVIRDQKDLLAASYLLRIAKQHGKLLKNSAISPQVAAARSYRSIGSKAELKRLGFGPSQLIVPTFLIPVWNVYGKIAIHQHRPDEPRTKNGKPVKYETPLHARIVLDVPPLIRHQLKNPRVPLFITEGVRKADSAVSHGLCCIDLLGVWNFRGTNEDGGKTALADWEEIALNSRQVYIVFDSDVMLKREVHAALVRLKGVLESRGAKVRVIYLPPAENGATVGLDDYLAAGHSTKQLLALASEQLATHNGADKPNGSQSAEIVKLIGDADLFHTSDFHPHATVSVNGHYETWQVDSAGFRRLLRARFYATKGAVPRDQALKEALGVLEGKALHDGPERPVYTRLAATSDAIYLDLGDISHRAVKITADGWAIVRKPCVRFRRRAGVQALPSPVRGGRIEELRQYINVESENDWRLVVAWLVAALRGRGPFPVLVVHGEQGSGKSTTAKVLRRLIDPNKAESRSPQRNVQDLAIAASHGWIVSLDNLSYLPAWFSDALCWLSTGGGFATRQLFSDDEEIIFELQRPVILNGIEEIATRSDLLDRCITIYLPPIAQHSRRDEHSFWLAFEKAQPRILGALLDVVSAALRALPTTALKVRPRLADFAHWITAAERSLGWEQGSFAEVYAANRAAANALALEASPIVATLFRLIDAKHGTMEGTASDLLEFLNSKASGDSLRQKGWPGNARVFSSILRRLQPNLREIGIDVSFGKTTGTNSHKTIMVRRVSSKPATPATPATHSKRRKR